MLQWSTYKRLCDQSDHWSRWMLDQSIDLLGQLGEEHLASMLGSALNGAPIEQPATHRGPVAAQMFVLTLPVPSRRRIFAAMQRAVELEMSTPATAQRGLGGFVEAWREYALDDDL